jgi:hypothetical protein
MYHNSQCISTFIIKNAFRHSEKLPHLLPLTFYLLLSKNPAIQGKSEEVRGKKYYGASRDEISDNPFFQTRLA